MQEILTIEAFDKWLKAFSVLGFFCCVGAGLVWAKKQTHPKRWQLGSLTGFLSGFTFPLLYTLWRFYLWRIRIDLERNFVGLHRVDVLIGNLLLFAVAGAIVGLIARLYANWLHRQLAQEERKP